VSYRAIEARIEKLASLRGPNLEVKLACCQLDENAHQIGDWIERWHGKVDELEVWRPHNWVIGRRYRSTEGRRLESCGRPASGPLQVQVDGTMNVCCFDYDGAMLIGDLRKQSFHDILQGDALRHIQELHAEGRADELPLCAVCDQREPPEQKRSCLVYTTAEDAEMRLRRTSSGREVLPLSQDPLVNDG
jgi:hypothetical protein